jgi:membrane protease YdiL (CAAX protease family)
MTTPGLPSLFFLGYLLILLPWMSYRSRIRLRANVAPARTAIWTGTLVGQAMLLLLSLMVGRTFDYNVLAVSVPGARDVGLAVLALFVCLMVRALSRSIRSPEERRKMAVYRWAPRSSKEWLLWTAVVVIASIAEEAAYRGVGMSILWYSLGSPWPAIAVLSAAFALAHATQGWKSMAMIFLIALVMHALVILTQGLMLAIAVHALYDIVTGVGISRTARQYDEQARATQLSVE